MNVTRENFSLVYPEIRAKILSCDFMSIDEEMTGIESNDYKQRNKKTDNPDERFARMVPVASTYGIVQFGLCLFHRVIHPDGAIKMEASPYNFFLFSDSGADIAMSASSISFLRNNKMDFGTWISKGLGYANQNGEAHLRKKYLEQAAPAKKDDTSRIVLTKDSDVAFLVHNTENLKSFLANNSQTEFVFDKCNPYLRKVLYQLIEFDYPTLTVFKNDEDRLQVLQLSEIEKEERATKAVEDGKISFQSAMGFRLVFLDLIAAKKPIIGHNCLFDFMFMMRWLDTPFKEGKIETLTDFKAKFNSYFPLVFDTKYIASCGIMGSEISDTSLGELYQTVVLPSGEIDGAKVKYASGFEQYYSSGGQFHDAGYDAFCTGALFCHQLGHLPMTEMIERAGNKLFMMYSMFHMNLDPTQPNGWLKITGILLYLGNFSADTKNDAVLQLFTAAGYELNQLTVSWIDGTSTFVSVDTPESNLEVIAKICVPENWRLKTYDQYAHPVIMEESAAVVGEQVPDSVGEPPLKKGRTDAD